MSGKGAAGLVSAAAACLSLAGHIQPAGAQGAIPPTVVVVRAGNELIRKRDVETYLARYYGRTALEQLIDRSLVRLEAARLKATVTEAELNARVAEAKRAAGDGFARALEDEGLDETAWRERVRADLLMEKVLETKWPVRESDLVRLSIRLARFRTEADAKRFLDETLPVRGQNFELLVRQGRSLDSSEFGGLVQPDPFLRVENPAMFRLAVEVIRAQGLRVGQMTRKPQPSKGFWLVMKVEADLPPGTLKEREREAAIRKIRAYRMPQLLPALRKRYRLEKPTAIPEDGLPADGEEVAVVKPPETEGGNAERTTGKALRVYLMTSFGRAALEREIERAVLREHANRLGVRLADAEVAERVASVKQSLAEAARRRKESPEKAFREALDTEGITEAAWRERVRYTYLAERVVNARIPLTTDDLVRLTARYVRLGTRQEADEVLAAARQGTSFDVLRLRSLDRGDGFVQPRVFLKAERPELHEALKEVAPGQVAPRVVALPGGFLVLKLEARFGPETLTAKEREEAVRRTNALRMGPLLDAWRKEIRIEYLVPLRILVQEVRRA